jgi:Mn-dependent DtxR family transcriptional regulator
MNMTTATAEVRTAATIQGLLRDISGLSDEGIQKLAEHVKWLLEEQEIAALEAKYGTTPNAETIAAMEEARANLDSPITLEEIQAECNALR